MSEFSVRGQRVVVVGGARSGIAAAHLLVRRGAKVTLNDRRPSLDADAELTAAGIRVVLGSHPAELFDAADLIVLSPGVPANHDACAAARAKARIGSPNSSRTRSSAPASPPSRSASIRSLAITSR